MSSLSWLRSTQKFGAWRVEGKALKTTIHTSVQPAQATMTTIPALQVQKVSHEYRVRQKAMRRALDELDLEVFQGEVFALLGPNGSGKSTLFRLISTLARLQAGDILVFGHSVRNAMHSVRSNLGVVFQSPSLDPKLTVLENIRCQAAMYGLSASDAKQRIGVVMQQLGIIDRAETRTEELSGGLKRRVELAKGILHSPRLLLMDEPSTGLDPAARLDMWHAIKELQRQDGVTVLLTTHLLEEAEKADRIAILDQGRSVALGAPEQLRAELGERILSIATDDRPAVMEWLQAEGIEFQQVEDLIRVADQRAGEILAPLASEFGARIHALTFGQPSLEDVFVARTGHRFWQQQEDPDGGSERLVSAGKA